MVGFVSEALIFRFFEWHQRVLGFARSGPGPSYQRGHVRIEKVGSGQLNLKRSGSTLLALDWSCARLCCCLFAWECLDWWNDGTRSEFCTARGYALGFCTGATRLRHVIRVVPTNEHVRRRAHERGGYWAAPFWTASWHMFPQTWRHKAGLMKTSVIPSLIHIVIKHCNIITPWASN